MSRKNVSVPVHQSKSKGSQNDSIEITDSKTEIAYSNDDIKQLKEQLIKYHKKNNQLTKGLIKSEEYRNELSEKLADAEKMSKKETNILLQILSDSKKYCQQIETELTDSEKQLKDKKNLENFAIKLIQELMKTKTVLESYQKQISTVIESKEVNDEKEISNESKIEKSNIKSETTQTANEKNKSSKTIKAKESKTPNEKPKPKGLVISMSQNCELQKLREENKNQLKAYNKLKAEFEELQYSRDLAISNLKNSRYTDCQTAGIISSLRIAKEKAEKLAAEYKEAKEKAEKQAAFEKKEKIRVKLQLENIQATMKNSLNKAASVQQQIEKAEAELNEQKKTKNRALLNAAIMRIAKLRAETEAAALKQQKDLAEEARILAEEKVAQIQADIELIEEQANEQRTALELALSQVEEAEQKALEEYEEKVLMEAELKIQMKENENLLKQARINFANRKD